MMTTKKPEDVEIAEDDIKDALQRLLEYIDDRQRVHQETVL